MSKREYRGRCHCGRVAFSFLSEPITEGKRCNCSICKRKGAIMSAVYFPAADFQLISGASDMTDYRWGDHDVNHLFCKSCGIYPYHGDDKQGYRVNLGCVDAINSLDLSISVIDGQAM